MNGWESKECNTEYQNLYFTVEQEKIEQPDGNLNTYYRINFTQKGGVIALGVKDGCVVFVDVYRPRLKTQLLELPGGGIKQGETAEEAARREFEEETGLLPTKSEHMGSVYFSAWTQSKRDIYWVSDFDSVEATPEAEIQAVSYVPLENVYERILSEPIAEWNISAITLADKKGYINPN